MSLSARLDDAEQYRYMVEQQTCSKDVYKVTYEASKDLKVAGKRAQLETLQEITGNKSYKPISEMSDNEFDLFWTDAHDDYGYDYDLLNKPLDNPKTKKYVDALRKKGYDFVVDMEDMYLDYSEGAVIALNSEDSIKRKKVEKWE